MLLRNRCMGSRLKISEMKDSVAEKRVDLDRLKRLRSLSTILELQVRDYRSDWELEVHQPVAGNYYPINLGIYIEDSDKEFSIMVYRSLGGSSIVDGQVELMLHRRLHFDDGRGVDEALNETVYASDECAGLTVDFSEEALNENIGAFVNALLQAEPLVLRKLPNMLDM